MRHVYQGLALGLVVTLLAGCGGAARQAGIGGDAIFASYARGAGGDPYDEAAAGKDQFALASGNRIARSGAEVDVLMIDYDEALEIAYKVAKENFDNAFVRKFDDGITIDNQDVMMANAICAVEPKIVKERKAAREYGIVFEADCRPGRGRPSVVPGYLGSAFFAALGRYRVAKRLKTARFKGYELLEDRGVAEVMPADWPIERAAFQKYLDDKRRLGTFEGIWSDDGGRNILGIVRVDSDPLFNYQAFVIASKDIAWKPGEIKVKFNRLRRRRPTISRFWEADKRESGVTWDAEPEFIISLNTPSGSRERIALVKTYPTGRRRDQISKVGTGWAITADGVFVTNAHVVEDAKEILVGFKRGDPKRARIVAMDQRLDLAVIRIEAPDKTYRPLPLAPPGVIENGTDVTVVGYPLAFLLGDDARVTDGVISAQAGFNSDVTRYQISAPIQGGSSGGPVLTGSGVVVGIVVSMMTLRNTQNENFAVKAAYLRPLLEQAGVAFKQGSGGATLSSREIFKRFGASVLPVWTK